MSAEIRIREAEVNYNLDIAGVAAVFDGQYEGYSGADVYWTLAAIDERSTPRVYLPDDLAVAGDRDLTDEAVDLATALDYFEPFVKGAGDA